MVSDGIFSTNATVSMRAVLNNETVAWAEESPLIDCVHAKKETGAFSIDKVAFTYTWRALRPPTYSAKNMEERKCYKTRLVPEWFAVPTQSR